MLEVYQPDFIPPEISEQPPARVAPLPPDVPDFCPSSGLDCWFDRVSNSWRIRVEPGAVDDQFNYITAARNVLSACGEGEGNGVFPAAGLVRDELWRVKSLGNYGDGYEGFPGSPDQVVVTTIKGEEICRIPPEVFFDAIEAGLIEEQDTTLEEVALGNERASQAAEEAEVETEEAVNDQLTEKVVSQPKAEASEAEELIKDLTSEKLIDRYIQLFKDNFGLLIGGSITVVMSILALAITPLLSKADKKEGESEGESEGELEYVDDKLTVVRKFEGGEVVKKKMTRYHESPNRRRGRRGRRGEYYDRSGDFTRINDPGAARARENINGIFNGK